MSESKFKAPKGFTRQSTNAVGFWDDNGKQDVLFVPTGVRLFDGTKKTDEKKPSMLMIGILRQPTTVQNKDEMFEAQLNDVIGVFWKPGMQKEIVNALGVETWIAPLLDENGERKTLDTGRASPMKLYDVRFAKKLTEAGKRLPILEDTRVQSKLVKTPFDDPSHVPLRPAKSTEAEEDDDSDDGDKIPF